MPERVVGGEGEPVLAQPPRELTQHLGEVARLGVNEVLGARADLEDELGHLAEAVELEERALRSSYLACDVAGIAVSHSNLARYLKRAGRRGDAGQPHRLGTALITFQTDSGRLAPTLMALGQDLAETAAPTSFAEVCAAVEQVEGVRFRELLAALPQRAASADDALAQVLALARQQAPGRCRVRRRRCRRLLP